MMVKISITEKFIYYLQFFFLLVIATVLAVEILVYLKACETSVLLMMS